jgi:hypothetical protein
MITIDATTLRRLQRVLRRTVCRIARNRLLISLAAEDGRLGVFLQVPGMQIRFEEAGQFGRGACSLPLEALLKIPMSDADGAELEATDEGVTLRWSDGGVPRATNVEAAPSSAQPQTLAEPTSWVTANPELRTALSAAHPVCSPETVRFATERICLRGARGQIAATDGRQLLVWDGFSFPWSDDLLIATFAMLDADELKAAADWRIGKAEEHVVLQTGSWTFRAEILKDGRFPNIDQVMPHRSASDRRLTLSRHDATFLKKTLPRLPGKDADYRPVTIELNGHVGVLAREVEGGPTTELELSSSRYDGAPLRFVCDREHLQRAVSLGLTELRIADANKPVLMLDDRRQFLFVPLGSSSLTSEAATFRLRSCDASASMRSNRRPGTPAPTAQEADVEPTSSHPEPGMDAAAIASLQQSLGQVVCDLDRLIQSLGHSISPASHSAS